MKYKQTNKDQIEHQLRVKNIKKPYDQFPPFQRFIDRADLRYIFSNSKDFRTRLHKQLPNWFVYSFLGVQALFVALIFYYILSLLQIDAYEVRPYLPVFYFFVLITIALSYALFIIRRLKISLNATEFMNLFMANSLEIFQSSYILVDDNCKVIYYNMNFNKDVLSYSTLDDISFENMSIKDLLGVEATKFLSNAMRERKEVEFDCNIVQLDGQSKLHKFKMLPLKRPGSIFLIGLDKQVYS